MALDQLNITNEPHNVFDHIRSSSKGIIDCIINDFTSFIPENKVADNRFKTWKPFIGEHFGFYHSGSLTDKPVLDSFHRKIERFIQHLNSDKKCIFLRTCVLPEYEEELNDMKTLYEVITVKYPKLSFIIVFIIPDQETTAYYGNINDKIFIFCLHNTNINNNTLGNEYKDIFTFISENNLFEIIPPSNQKIHITKPTSSLCLVDDIPAVNYFGRYTDYKSEFQMCEGVKIVQPPIPCPILE